MREVNAIRVTVGNLHHIVFGTGAKRTGTQGQTIGLRWHGLEQPVDILCRRDDARQAQNIAWRIVGMDAQAHAKLFGKRHHGTQECLTVAANISVGQSVIQGERGAQTVDGVAVISAGQPGHDAGEQGLTVRLAAGVEPAFGGLLNVRIVIRFSAIALQHEHLERGHLHRIEAQGGAATRQGRIKRGSRPVQQRHEIVADSFDATGGQIAHGLAVIFKQRFKIAVAAFNRFMDRQTFHHLPGQAVL